MRLLRAFAAAALAVLALTGCSTATAQRAVPRCPGPSATATTSSTPPSRCSSTAVWPGRD
ncbi:hypothetical protein O1M63_47035 [Streptomyces mirabilis]|nr:hypothetical protein [Streptomyces mirabilis]